MLGILVVIGLVAALITAFCVATDIVASRNSVSEYFRHER